MKKVLLLIAAVVMFASCSKDDVGLSGLIGKWKDSQRDYPMFDFNSNGSLMYYVNDNNEFEGTYRISGDVVILTSKGFEDSYSFKYKVDGNKLSMTGLFEEVWGSAYTKNYNLIRK